MKLLAQRNHDPNNTGGGDNGGLDLSGLGIGDDDDLGSKPAKVPTAIDDGKKETTPATSPEPKKVEEKPVEPTKVEKKDEVPAEEAKAVTVDDVTYQLNDKGDAIDKDGNIFKTKEELDSLQAQEDELPLVEEILQKSGYKFTDDKGKPKVYDDTPEGLLDLANDIATEKNKVSIKKFFDQFPSVKEYAEHLQRGGTDDQYFQKRSTSWTNVKFDEKDEALLTNAVVAQLMTTGMTKEHAEATAKLYKETDKLKDFGKAAYTTLVNSEKEKDRLDKADFEKRQKEQEDKDTKHWNNVKSVITKGALNNITIPETEREEFFNYIAFAADESGNAKADIDEANLPIEQKLQIKYLIFKGVNLDALIKNAVKTDKARSLRDRTRSGQKGLGGGEGPDKTKYTKVSGDDISLETVIQ
jgi:hypothetical protein